MESVLIHWNAPDAPEQWQITSRGTMEFWSRESATCLGDAFASWFAARSVRRETALNPFLGTLPANFATIRIPPADSNFHPPTDSSFCAEVSMPNPMDFIIRAPGYPPIRVGDITNPLQQRALMADLLDCRGFRYPLYQQVEQDTAGFSLQYMRLMLPVVDKNGAVNKIYTFCRPLAGNSQSLQEQMVRLTWSELP